MTVITIRLVGENDDRLFEGIDVDNQIPYVDLKKRIETITKIPPDFQEVRFRGEKLPVVEYPIRDIKFGEELELRHSQLSMWTALLDREAAFSQSHEQELKKSIHMDAKTLIESLLQSNFFLVYPSLGTRRFAIEKKFITYFDRKVEQIRSCCRAYFSKVYGEKSKVTFGSREDGSRAGCICIVDDGSTIRRYYIKTHHGAGDKSSHSQYDIDIKELFVYTFLEALKMGAEIKFISNELFSRWIIFLASREIPNFSTLEVLELTEAETIQRYSKSVVEMLCVYSILMLADHHTANMGFDTALNPYILDFFITGRRLTGVRDMHDGVRMSKIINATLGTLDERIKISTEYLIKSNFSDVFERSIASFLEHHKPEFDKMRLVFDKVSKTDDLLEYVDNVRKNIRAWEDTAIYQKDKLIHCQNLFLGLVAPKVAPSELSDDDIDGVPVDDDIDGVPIEDIVKEEKPLAKVAAFKAHITVSYILL